MPPKQHQIVSAPAAPLSNNTDRLRLNVQQVREQQQINRERKAIDELEAQKAQARIAKSKAQYSHVAPRVGPGAAVGATSSAAEYDGDNNYQAPHDDVEITVFVRECEPDGGVQRMMESEILRQNARSNGNQQPASIPRNIAQQQQQPSQRAAVAVPQPTYQRVPLQTQQDNAHKPGAPDGHGKLGSVPSYLLQRKAELQAEKDAAAKAIEDEREKSRHPPGHRPVSEEERVAVLAKLDARKLELERDLARLPMRFDTIAVKNRRSEIEREMAEVEEAHRRFSVKKTLYVPL